MKVLRRQALAGVYTLGLFAGAACAQEVLVIDEFFPGVGNHPATISLHIGAQVQEVRGVFLLFERSGYGVPVFESAEWRNFFASRSMAFVMIEDYRISNGPLPEFGLDDTILNALSTFATRPSINRPALATAPFISWGLSRSALWATNMAAAQPDRAAGFIVFRMLDTTDLAITTHPTTDIDRVDEIPALILGGERDGIIPLGAQQAYNQLRRGRARNAPWTGGIERGRGHTDDALDTRIIHPWIDAMLQYRIPAAPGPLVALSDEAGYFGDLGEFVNTPPDPDVISSFLVSPVVCYPLDASNTSWMPSVALSEAWQTLLRPGQGVIRLDCCDDLDFNNDGASFDPQDIDAFLSVFSEGDCVPTSATCSDIDFNNDGTLFDPCDIDAFLLVFSEGPCTLCGQ